MTVFPRFAGGDIDDFARFGFQQYVAAFAEGGGLDRVGEGGVSVAGGFSGLFFFIGEVRRHDDVNLFEALC